MIRTAPRVAPPRDEPFCGWDQSLSIGAPGIALLHAEHALAGASDWTSAHEWIAAATRSAIAAHPDACGLFRGAPAVAFALRAFPPGRYAGALSILDAHTATLTRKRLQDAHTRIDRAQPPALREFDLVSGLTGLGAYWLRACAESGLLRDILTYLVRLAQPLVADGRAIPGWWTRHAPHDRPSAHWPGGHANFGMAHGIAGPLALLALAFKRGVTVPGHADAIKRICASLDRWQSNTRRCTWWPEAISMAEWTDGTLRLPGPQRPSWCYGTPGLARAQQLAGQALGDTARQRLAEEALAGCLADDAQLSQLRDATLCHGWAGVLQVTWRVARDADPERRLGARLPDLCVRMDQHLQRHGLPTGAGLLEGTAGVDLSRFTIAADAAPRSHWDACLLLDD